ncbi:winged helix-turn-helix transcriptional regulator [candidate division KSB1 bacterium]|nr:winged helix-turn-helix transcriptional regulator [candidate division KSB1 bacterium]NIR69304.1 winged helix-turn-helix transcriptional regulator [candidate division KSB1 bacterium]NIS22710.1 winged helix-turn-helix transcriptional regulator [candidate division KSB1 bacterium]NIT69556.1 winged helix-turn-helix transcriptional regulator [candidate division KSB1 bacterium]NIU23210.1 winged helix-turn-helix transcriptional regulator [candidate division KSB1 bacterium]
MNMNQTETCELFFVDEKKVKSVERKLSENGHLFQLSETFKLLGDLTRLKIILALKEEELCVCDLATLLGVSRSAVSHQLRLLKTWRLVKCRRDGKIAYYSLDDTHIGDIIGAAEEHLNE